MLTGKQKRYLRSQGSLLKPTVSIGKEGLTQQVISECNRQLIANELVKVRVQKNYFGEIKEAAAELEKQTGSFLAGAAGRNFLLYLENKDKKLYDLP
ncbi:YhbY family RNA-binding protein [Clostridia bacterium]|nr:YhbY family RNA-binding protein [Clostridia bacterium]